jgi:hypothetical protein
MMPSVDLEPCPDCGALLPPSSGAGHWYVGASAACWELFAALNNAGEPPLAPSALNGLLTDAYMVQHPGVPSPQAIQSVAVHLLVLYGVLERGVDPGRALWIRLQALDERHGPKHGRFSWLTPPSFAGSLTVADIVKQPTPGERTAVLQQYVTSIWSLWAARHAATITAWYDRYVGSG